MHEIWMPDAVIDEDVFGGIREGAELALLYSKG